MLKLYHANTSVCSQKVRIALAEIGLGYDSVLLNLQQGDQFAPAYTALNPNAVVPTLIDDDLVLLESSLIAEYLDKTYNDSRLMPDDPRQEARVRLWLLRCLAVHAAINTLSFSTFMRDKAFETKSPEEIEAGIARMPDPIMRNKRRDLFAHGLGSDHVEQALRHLHRAFADMSADIGAGTWVSGPAFGLADIGLVAYVDRLDRLGFAGLWEDDFPAVGTWLAAMQARPSYATAIEAFIPEQQAHSQRAGGGKHWPALQDRWNEIRA
ncbi:glutathione S-transferase family protein [Marinovum sp.]|uniref:glutathione S-transferase family protein n=1 Tax=Marinovum sp. TaxID=2024839 RepID=UPI002B27AC33|nr:glutathione S-transferase family protein [Marinovum sp.]